MREDVGIDSWRRMLRFAMYNQVPFAAEVAALIPCRRVGCCHRCGTCPTLKRLLQSALYARMTMLLKQSKACMFKHVLASGGRRSYETLKYSRFSPPVHGWDPAAPTGLVIPMHVCSSTFAAILAIQGRLAWPHARRWMTLALRGGKQTGANARPTLRRTFP